MKKIEVEMAWEAIGLTCTEKLVLVRLAYLTNQSSQCAQAISEIAKACSCSRATVIRAIESLRRKGHLHREKTSGQVNSYIVEPIPPEWFTEGGQSHAN